MPSRNRNAWGWPHQRTRTRYKNQLISAGFTQCTCERPECTHHDGRCPTIILPDDPWHLGHDETAGGYRGIECVPCNTSDGARRGNALRRPTITREW